MNNNEKRPTFKTRGMFLFAMMGSVIGLGNIWRFPSVLYTNGGGSFLVAYLIVLFVLGISHLFLEYGIGFNFKSSVAGIYSKINKKFEFLGWFVPLNIYLVLTYYVCILSWSTIYFILSFTNGWGTNTNSYFENLTLHSTTPTLSSFTHFSIYVILGLLIMWALIWLCSSRDVEKGIGKICKILIPALFIIIVIILIIAFTLPGSYIGISTLFEPKWEMLLNPGLWLVVLAQIAFSMGLGDSTAITFTSYIDKESHLMDNAIIVSVTNFIFGIVASLSVFGILGYMSYIQSIPINHVVSEGTGLVFVAFPTIFNNLDMHIIGPLFFLCFIFAGFTSAIALMEPLGTSISNKFGLTRKKTMTILTIIGCLFSLIYATGCGQFMVTLADNFLNEITLSISLIAEGIIFAWYFGAEKLVETLNKHSQFKVGKKWIIIVKYIMPAVIIYLWINGVYKLIKINTPMDWIGQGIYIAILIIIPLILTKLPAKTKSFYEK